ncbi:MAG TPA: GDP-mannose 4,6-dehydratase [Anaerolineaceae bacterium]|nr:GDP-mannose 4,6-dehydratase [Anaerolineaceae bacterium]HOU45505.1 GDP-mannose 4,6-dehydratase [Anaerolineaceae bacterium]HPA32479.1 GDP-mannose 4,6-dehydratase [Anaerolineaceae bacterium]HQF45776.1 GDP-mannose 4,6-dehydratase [Anaerolineaceae bacterium]HQH35356.1 GDP-mannose 4,6-dehydratase [Anaerolineaceae bacterium]
MKKALITGITGQDGSYLAELLLHKGYEVHGLIRRASTFNTRRIDHIYHDPHGNNGEIKLYLHYGDVAVPDSLLDVIYNVRPDEIYHLAAQSHVRVSFDMPEYTGDVTGLGTIRILEAIRKSGIQTRFYQASSSEMFGAAKPPQSEITPFEPRSPYAAAKVYSYWVTRNYREGYHLHASNGILFNHESPRRGETFVTRKITRALAAIRAGRQSTLYLGNLDARRDWGYAPEYVEVMWKILQKDAPADYVIGTGESHSIREFLDEAFGYAGMDWHQYVQIDARYFRPTEVDFLLADPTRARTELDWQPKVTFRDLVRIMVDADLELQGLPMPGEGRRILEERFGGWHRWEHQVVSMER